MAVSGDNTIAVVIPVYNRARTIFATLQSVARQTHAPAVLVVIDDGSSDDIEASMEQWQRESQPRFPVILRKQANQGAAAARNHGLRLVPDATLVAFLDSDDAWPDDFLARCQAALSARPDAVAVSCNQDMVDFSRGTHKSVRLDGIADNAVAWMYQHGAGIGSCSLFRRRAIEQAGGYPEQVMTGHDTCLFVRVSLLGPWLHAPGTPVCMGRNHSGGSGDSDHLCRSYRNYEERWAQVFDDLAHKESLSRFLPVRELNRQLARRWYRAAKQWAKHGDPARAADCYRRSLSYRKNFAAWLRLHTLPWFVTARPQT
ncbi:glycosyltransferase family A protein [Arenimonas sp.]|uniref:glycosyltransferase family A protein n=1 Tax=Arenimonas sp. TaxID=1872635 RepID=UPI0039E6C66F